MKRLSIFCSSKKDFNKNYIKDTKTLFKYLGNKYKYSFGGGNDGLMGVVRGELVNYGCDIFISNCLKWRDLYDETIENTIVEYFDNITDRQKRLIEVADGFIVFPGGLGTIYELLQVITMNDIKEHRKPVFILNMSNYFMSLIDMIEWGRKMGMITKTNEELCLYVKDNGEELSKCINEYYKN